ncbi:MAG: CAP domain-containing protein [Candidatus Solibacter sp.]
MTRLRNWRLPFAAGIAGLAMLMAAFAGIGFDGRASALTNCTVADNSIDAEEQAFLGLINTYRSQNGLGALTMSTNLNRASTWMAADMGVKKYFSHTDSLGRSPSTRAIDCGYPQGAGENIAAGTNWSTASAVFAAWKASSGHNANMLNGAYRQIGISRVFTSGSPYGWYWVTDFGTTNDGTNGGGGTTNPTATPTRTATQPPAATATPTRTPTQPPPASGPAWISSPAAGSTLPGASATFSWQAVSGGLEYFLYVGTGGAGSNNLVGRSIGTATSTTVTNLPTAGGTVYVRLWTRFAAGWQFTDATYTAANVGGGGATEQKAAMTSPAAGSQLGTSATFAWSAGSGALEYFFYLGTVPGSNNLVGASMGTSRSISLSNLPRGSQPLYVRLWTRLATGWQFTDYSYTAAP